MPLRATQFFDAGELTSKLRNDGTNNDPALVSIMSRKPSNLPSTYAQFSDDHKSWLQEFLCAGVKVSYQENEQFLATG
jgi:hypothetical protein